MTEKLILNQEEALKVASLNLYNNPESFNERSSAAVLEAKTSGVDTLLVQELLVSQKQKTIECFTKAGYKYSQISQPAESAKTPLYNSSTAIFSKQKPKLTKELNLTALSGAQRASVMVQEINGYEVHLISVHLAWGAENSTLRFHQAVILGDYSRRVMEKNPKAIIVLGGTLNETPDGDSVRYFKGLKVSPSIQSTFWLDATAGTEYENTSTTRPLNKWGQLSAEHSGIILPTHIPARKTDYLFINGWVYGKPGMPFQTELFGITKTLDNQDISDHYGLQTNIWLPKS